MTETDKRCEHLVLTRIHKTFPDHKFIGEEGSAAQASCAGGAAGTHWFTIVCSCFALTPQS